MILIEIGLVLLVIALTLEIITSLIDREIKRKRKKIRRGKWKN